MALFNATRHTVNTAPLGLGILITEGRLSSKPLTSFYSAALQAGNGIEFLFVIASPRPQELSWYLRVAFQRLLSVSKDVRNRFFQKRDFLACALGAISLAPSPSILGEACCVRLRGAFISSTKTSCHRAARILAKPGSLRQVLRFEKKQFTLPWAGQRV